jgi:hypothetical protein
MWHYVRRTAGGGWGESVYDDVTPCMMTWHYDLQVEVEERAARKALLVLESPEYLAAFVIQKRWRKVRV